MIITSFYPAIASTNPAKTIKVYESIGFEVRHEKMDDGMNSLVTIMKNENGDRVAVVCSDKIPTPCTLVHINVDYFEEAIDHFSSLGFEMIAESNKEGSSSLDAVMKGPDGEYIHVCQHVII